MLVCMLDLSAATIGIIFTIRVVAALWSARCTSQRLTKRFGVGARTTYRGARG